MRPYQTMSHVGPLEYGSHDEEYAELPEGTQGQNQI
jgi:hypothetical protein